MSEFTDAIELANRLLDEPYTDPDDDLRVLSRQLLRRQETVERLENRLAELSDSTRDMIESNRDSILRMHEEAVRRISKVVKKYVTDEVSMSIGALDAKLIQKIIHAVNLYHPMHGESWPGWPEGS